MKDLLHDILNATTSIGYYSRKLPIKERTEVEKLLKRIERALLCYKGKCDCHVATKEP